MGLVYALGAYLCWGLLVPLHFRLLGSLPPWTILAHRILWSSLFVLLLLVVLRGRRAPFVPARRHALLAVSALLIAVNWSLYLWAVQNGHMVEASLGYFINPLVAVALGAAVLGERLRPLQAWAVGLAAAGVAAAVALAGTLPWLALALATSFALYALIRKLVPIDPILGFGAETVLLLPAALAYLAGAAPESAALPALDGRTAGLLLLTGITTSLPLIWFAAAARRLKLATLGLMQYLSPTCTLLLSVTVFGESLDPARAAVFGFTWIALALYAADAVRLSRSPAPPLAPQRCPG
ncbi:RarD protein, DMT superfamily transporter [Methylobacterium sp. 4-46]|uniref:EamA family transporter RarD n=1 Tax=unclassified Methylobacterium TaxID=2615210 RepID=UPI000165CADD|nr:MULTISPECIES: EamA family transporter RarD [Methylobacterium]ACA19257.1 RarD protein, DMT superfamily transporter [Methylobacterium sp. 4-46]WFT78464.1 EamA family transporter RarD [Methylobacterium nodulans]